MSIIEQTAHLTVKTDSRPVILLVEDEPSLLSVLEKIISKLDCRLVTAVDGADAYVKFEKFKPVIVVTDVIMPKLNGFDLIQKLRAKYKNTFKVMVLTNLNNPSDAEMASSLNVDYMLLKANVSLRNIELKVQELLN